MQKGRARPYHFLQNGHAWFFRSLQKQKGRAWPYHLMRKGRAQPLHMKGPFVTLPLHTNKGRA